MLESDGEREERWRNWKLRREVVEEGRLDSVERGGSGSGLSSWYVGSVITS